MRRVLALASLLLAACAGGAPLGGDAGALGGRGQGRDAGGDACDPYAASNQPLAPCAKDSDCHDPFLACVRTTLMACRDATEPADAGACPPPAPDDLPVCPATAAIATSVCTVRYQIACGGDADCGPTGFTCTNGSCVQTSADGLCESVADCPDGWQCYAPCPCATQPAPQKRCEPPFAAFGCPACPTSTGP